MQNSNEVNRHYKTYKKYTTIFVTSAVVSLSGGFSRKVSFAILL